MTAHYILENMVTGEWTVLPAVSDAEAETAAQIIANMHHAAMRLTTTQSESAAYSSKIFVVGGGNGNAS